MKFRATEISIPIVQVGKLRLASSGIDSSEARSPSRLRGKVWRTRTSGGLLKLWLVGEEGSTFDFPDLGIWVSRSMMDSERRPGGQGDDSVGKVLAT